MKKWKNLLKVVCFVLCFLGIFGVVQKRFMMEDRRIYQTMRGFYEEPENSLDMIYVGSSNVYAYYQAPLAWNDFGFTSFSLSIPGLPMHATKYMIEEARKTQPDALYVINMNNFRRGDFDVNYLHFSTNWIKFSRNKVEMIAELSKVCGVESWTDLLEFYIPLIRYHSAWNELERSSFDFTLNGLKGAADYNPYLKSVEDVSEIYHTSEIRTEPEAVQKEVLEDLLDYIEENDVNVLFVSVPQAIKSDEVLGQWNTLGDMIEERGHAYLNLFPEAEAMGMNMSTDLYNKLHTNVHGAIAYTHYFGTYIAENYDFTDKRSDPAYAGWNESYEKYKELISEYVFDFELENAKRDYAMSVPVITKCKEGELDITLAWEPSDGAESYVIYRKEENTALGEKKPWIRIGETADLSYLDSGLTSGITYTYTVVATRIEGDAAVYGVYDMKGRSNTIR